MSTEPDKREQRYIGLTEEDACLLADSDNLIPWVDPSSFDCSHITDSVSNRIVLFMKTGKVEQAKIG